MEGASKQTLRCYCSLLLSSFLCCCFYRREGGRFRALPYSPASFLLSASSCCFTGSMSLTLFLWFLIPPCLPASCLSGGGQCGTVLRSPSEPSWACVAANLEVAFAWDWGICIIDPTPRSPKVAVLDSAPSSVADALWDFG